MAVNTMGFEQAASLLTAITSQATGTAVLAPTDLTSFVTVGQKALSAGYEPLLGAISQVVGKTIYSSRAYEDSEFKTLSVTSQYYGGITRKLKTASLPVENSSQFALTDNTSIDMYTIRKQPVLELNFYGADEYQYHRTIYKDQVNSAFHGPQEFGDFMTMLATEAADDLTQNRESMARACINNFITGKLDASNGVIHLLTEYNAKTGLSLTATTVFDPANYPAFVKWMFARVEELSNMMSKRNNLYQINVTGYDIKHHTPRSRQKFYINAGVMSEITDRVLADTYHNNFLSLATTEKISYWQSPNAPTSVQAKPIYLQTNGTVAAAAGNVSSSVIYGVIIDEEAAGLTLLNEEMTVTPYNSRGKYWNVWSTGTWKWWNDFNEKGIVLCLD